jgi:hypothetical protein
LIASLSLFGWQDAVRDCAFDALIGALSEDGLLIREGTQQRHIALTLLEAHWDVSTGLQMPSISDSVRIKFLTPCKLGPAGTIGTRYSDIWVSCALRAQAIAHWHGCELGIDLGHIRALARAMLYDDSGLFGSRWERWSSRTGKSPRAMMGLSGELCIQRWRQDLTPLLVLGEAANVGAETAFGLGRFAAF